MKPEFTYIVQWRESNGQLREALIESHSAPRATAIARNKVKLGFNDVCVRVALTDELKA